MSQGTWLRNDGARLKDGDSGGVPAGWQTVRFGRIARQRSVSGRVELGLLSVYLGRGVIPYAEGGQRVHAPSADLADYQEVRPGDLVMNNQQAWRGSVGVSRFHGIVSPAYHVYELSPVSAGYAAHLLTSPQMVDQYLTASKGVGDIQRTLYVPYLKQALVPIPPADEQAAIIKYLGHAHSRIDRAIAAKRRLIALLEEQKQVVIHQAVTRGLDPSVPLRDSGIAWLGEIPSHWVTRRAKNFLREVDERSLSGLETQLSVSHITGVTPRKSTVTMFRAESYVGHKVCRSGDLVVNTMWAWMGALGFSRQSGIVSPSYSVFRFKSRGEINENFLELLVRTPKYISQMRSESTGIRPSRLRLYPDQLLAMAVIVPPEDEQSEIVTHVRQRTQEFTNIVEKAQIEIQLLREFRARLTSDVVTGQLDVRDIAGRLPELTEETLEESGADGLDVLMQDSEEFLEEVDV